MPTGIVTVSQYTAEPPVQIDPASTFEVRGFYPRDFIGGDSVTPIYGNTTSGEQGPYYDVDCSLNGSGNLIVPAHDIQATTLSNPTANYFEGLWVDGAFTQMLMPNNNVTSGWQIPTIYGAIIAIDEIALYNRAKRLLFPPDTYPTFDEVILLIQRLAGNFDYAAVGVNGITSMSFAPVVASLPIALSANDPKVGSWFNIAAYGASTANTAAQNTIFVAAAVTAAAGAGGGIYWPVGFFQINSITISVPVMFAPGESGPRPASGQTVTFTGPIWADQSKHFDTLTSGGLVSFAGSIAPPEISPLWWKKNAIPGTTDMTTAIQAALDTTEGRGNVHFPSGSYLVTNTLTTPDLGAGFSPVKISGDGWRTTFLVNKASASTPTLLVTTGVEEICGIGFWGDQSFPNDLLKVIGGTGAPATYPSRLRIHDCQFVAQGNGIFLESLHSVWITDNFGFISGANLAPSGVTTFPQSLSQTGAFIYVNQPVAGFTIQLVVENNLNEGYNYPVYTSGVSQGAGQLSWTIMGNQFEGSANGLKLDFVNDPFIAGNYLGEGSTGYSINANQCLGGQIGPNEIHFSGFDALNSAVKLTDCTGVALLGFIPRVYLTGTSLGVTYQNGYNYRIQDESSDNKLSLVNVSNNTIGGIPKFTINTTTGSAEWFTDDPTAIIAYPTVRLGDKAWKVTPTAGTSPGWIATRASSAGAKVHTVGAGPSPTVLSDYPYPIAYDYKIVVVTGGVTDTATYDVYWKIAGGGVYAKLNSPNPLTTSELAHLVVDDVGGGPGYGLSILWPTSQTYVSGDTWTLTAVVAPIWRTMAAIA